MQLPSGTRLGAYEIQSLIGESGPAFAGTLRRNDGTPHGIAAFALATKRFQRVPNLDTDSTWMLPVWLSDSRRFVLRNSHGLSVVDATTGATKRLLAVRGYAVPLLDEASLDIFLYGNI